LPRSKPRRLACGYFACENADWAIARSVSRAKALRHGAGGALARRYGGGWTCRIYPYGGVDACQQMNSAPVRCGRTRTDSSFLNSFTFARHPRGMSQQAEFDCQGQAETAMKMAAATTGYERLKWVRLAPAWHELAALRARLAVANEPMLPTTHAAN
jgi:hypothetical protein